MEHNVNYWLFKLLLNNSHCTMATLHKPNYRYDVRIPPHFFPPYFLFVPKLVYLTKLDINNKVSNTGFFCFY